MNYTRPPPPTTEGEAPRPDGRGRRNDPPGAPPPPKRGRSAGRGGCGLRTATAAYIWCGVIPALISAGMIAAGAREPIWVRALLESGIAAAIACIVHAAAITAHVRVGERPSTRILVGCWVTLAHTTLTLVGALFMR